MSAKWRAIPAKTASAARLVRGRHRPHLAALCPDEDRGAAAAGGRARKGSRIMLADGRELIDGIASWWTACHGYNHPHIRAAVERQLEADAACDVRRAGARAGVDAGAAADGAAAGRSHARILFRTPVRSRSKSR